MKIKQKKQLNLPQLIEWGFEKGSHGVQFKSDRGKRVGFRHMGDFWTEYEIDKAELFTIITEEEITEDTVIDKLMTTFKKTCIERGIGHQRVRIDENYPIKLMLNKAEAHRERLEALHIVNDDGTHTLIWREGKLVE